MDEERQPQAYASGRPWPRQLLRQALALTADHLQRESAAPFPLSLLLAHLRKLDLFGEATADRWLAIALDERLILIQETETASLNRRHPLVQQALLMRERILTTLSILQEQQGWVAFSTLELALRTCRICAGSSRSLQLWLELLIKLGVLQMDLQPQPDGPFQTTILALNPASPVIAVPKQQQQRNQLRLILACSHYNERNQDTPLTASRILRTLTGPITHVEAREAMEQAEQEGIIKIEYLTDESRTKRLRRTLLLLPEHERVRACLELRNHLIHLIEESLRKRPSGISATTLVIAFRDTYQLPEDEGWFWLRVLEEDGILRLSSLTVGSSQKKEKIVDLRLGDPIVELARQHVRR